MFVELTATQILIGLLSLLLVGWLIFCIIILFTLGREHQNREPDKRGYGSTYDAITSQVPLAPASPMAEHELV